MGKHHHHHHNKHHHHHNKHHHHHRVDVANKIIEDMQKEICGPECMHDRELKKLKKHYDKSKANVKNAPAQFEEARRNYFIFAFGKQYYENFERKRLEQITKKMGEKLISQHETTINELNHDARDYKNSFFYLHDMKELLRKYKEENKVLFLRIEEQRSDAAKNARKVFYEDEEIDNINYTNFLLFTMYWILFGILGLVILIIVVFTYKKQGNMDKKELVLLIVPLLLAILYPFLAPLLLKLVFKIGNAIQDNWPTEKVYTNL
jgi:arsenate reductase-like glutaredoxin family protein